MGNLLSRGEGWKRDPWQLRSLGYEIVKFNKEMQADEFRGVAYRSPSVSYEMQDRWNEMIYKYRFLQE
ncbi:unnamed protein product [Blepharisma stoltei]|uniref:Uncharacterized protein n=1 Tax=Blepharisma stoltei TaxID=1481888 RepID=A0AAU9JAP6_9CILI|nr:unnamed protein product [Blepharisma stoltei]